MRWHGCRDKNLHDDIFFLAEKMRSRRSGRVGDPNDVHHIIPPHHSLWYAVYRSADGVFIKEIIDGLDRRLFLLRKNRRIIAVVVTHMVRHESYKGVDVV